MATTCPGGGYYPGARSGEKSDVVALSDSCSTLCEFRLCFSDERLIPCAVDATPNVVVRAPFAVAHPDHRPFGSLVLMYGRERLTLKCQPVGAPCFPCATDEQCFSGGRCIDGHCVTTALCQ